VEGAETSSGELLPKMPLWRANIRSAVGLLRSSASRKQPVALLGFSRGAFLAVMVANRTPGVSAVVDFYGGAQVQPDSLDRQLRHFPPLLILHGEKDQVVPVQEAFRLKQEVEARGGSVEMHVYPGGNHGLTNPDTMHDALQRTLEFLRRRLPTAPTTARPGGRAQEEAL
jgi:dienelactone hydrolase